jgi:hypothetical protein
VFGLRVRKPTGLYCVQRSSGCKINGRQQVHSLASALELHSVKRGVQECLQNIYSSMGHASLQLFVNSLNGFCSSSLEKHVGFRVVGDCSESWCLLFHDLTMEFLHADHQP